MPILCTKCGGQFGLAGPNRRTLCRRCKSEHGKDVPTGFSHGGKRPGCGRPAGSGKWGKTTTTMRVPSDMAAEVSAYITARMSGGIEAPRFVQEMLEAIEQGQRL